MSFGQKRKPKRRKSRGKARKFRKIERHPLKHKIIEWISVGWSPYRILKELKALYPDNKRLWIDPTTLWEYQNAHPELSLPLEQMTEDDETLDMATRIMRMLGRRSKPLAESRAFTRKELLEFRQGIDGFIKFCHDVLKWDGKPVKLMDYQIEIAKKMLKYKRTITLTGRQVGKDFICGCFCVWEATCNPQWLTLIVSAAQRQCVDKETEVLTKDGFKYFKDITYNDEIATLNRETFYLEYQKPDKVISYPYNGEMIHWGGYRKQHDIMVTPNHNMFVEVIKYGKPNLLIKEQAYQTAKRAKYSYYFKRTSKWKGSDIEFFELPKLVISHTHFHYHDPKHKQRHSHRHNYYQKYHTHSHTHSHITNLKLLKPIPIKLYLELMGWFLSEGWTIGSRGGKIRSGCYYVGIGNTNPNYRKEIFSLFKKIGLNPKNRGVNISVRNKQLHSYLKQFGCSYEKFVPNVIKNLSPELILHFLKPLFKGDGSFKNGKIYSYSTTSKKLADDIQELLLKCGFAASMQTHKPKSSDNWNIKYHILITRNYKDGVEYEPKKVKYNGKVYCVTVPNGLMLIRRNGKIVWTGNSDLLLGRILTFIASSQQLLDSIANSTQEGITFTNGAKIVALPATGIIRGYTNVNRVICNEVRDMPDVTFAHVTPMVGIAKGSLYLFSTPPPGKIGYLWQVWNNPMFKMGRTQVPTHMNKYFPKEEIELARETMPFATFQIEYLGQWADVGPVYIPIEKVDAVSVDYDTYLPEEPEEGKIYSGGWDPARINDYSVFIVTSRDIHNFVKVEYVHEFTPGTSLGEQVEYIKYLDDHFHFRHIVGEYVGIGIAPIDALEEYFGSTIVEKFVATLDRNFDKFENLKTMIEHKKIQLPLTALKLRNQLCMLEYKTTPTGKLQIKASEMDFADSAAMAVWPWRKSKYEPYGAVVNI